MPLTLRDRADAYARAFGRFPAGRLQLVGVDLAQREEKLRRLHALLTLNAQAAPPCSICRHPASCFGVYGLAPVFACDRCCGHGQQGGWCEPLSHASTLLAEVADLGSDLWVVDEQRGPVLYGIWMIGQDYQNPSTYYGAHPKGYLERVLSLFPDVTPSPDTLFHAFSGSLPPGPYTRCDLIQPAEFQCRIEELPSRVGFRRWPLVLADPPYSQDDARKYHTVMIDRLEVMNALAGILEPQGHVVWLDTVWPMFSSERFRTVARICLIRSTNHRVRLISIFERQSV